MTSFYIVTSYYTKYTKVFFPFALSNFISVLNIAEYCLRNTTPLALGHRAYYETLHLLHWNIEHNSLLLDSGSDFFYKEKMMQYIYRHFSIILLYYQRFLLGLYKLSWPKKRQMFKQQSQLKLMIFCPECKRVILNKITELKDSSICCDNLYVQSVAPLSL
jgi:hypothetical protein